MDDDKVSSKQPRSLAEIFTELDKLGVPDDFLTEENPTKAFPLSATWTIPKPIAFLPHI
jgi:hypothetical protein